MSLLNLYIEKSKEKNWQEKTGENKEDLYLFEFTGNFRNLLMFEDGFKTYSKLCSMDGEQLGKYIEQNPAQAKSFIANMNRTKLFMTSGNKRVRSAKGEVFEKFLLEKMSKDDRWFVDYLFVVDSYFKLETNYIFAQTERVFNKWLKAGYTLGQIYNSLIYLFNIREGNMEEYLRTEHLVMITFINDPDFLKAYRAADEFEKGELHDYIADNYNKARYNCPVSAKFSPAALTDCDTVLDDAKILFFSHYLMNSHPISLEDMLDIFSQVYTRFYKLNTKKTVNFVMMYEDVFRMTYLNLFSDMQDFYLSLKMDDDILANTYEHFSDSSLDELIKDNVDYTTTDSINALAKLNSMLSANAKLETGYRCELDAENGCRYFTSKHSSKPYLEIHQLIPRDYANEFNVPVERASNYVALCPHCHRLIHNASDEERFKVLAQIYAKRKERLDADGIIPTNELLFAIYGIEQSKLSSECDFSKPQLEKPQPKLAAGTGASAKKPAAKRAPRAAAKTKAKTPAKQSAQTKE